jgi:hypothetical protein
MTDIPCPECGHPLSEHDLGGCTVVMPNGDYCECCNNPDEVALLILGVK